MLTLYRSNRAELLAQVLATRLRLAPPGPLEQIQVVVNTWPTSRWLGEQIALGNGAGIAANLRFPFPSARLRQLVGELLREAEPNADAPDAAGGRDPWRAQNLVWPVLELLPELLEQAEPPFGRERHAEHLEGRGECPQAAGPVEVEEVAVRQQAAQHELGEGEHEALLHGRAL